jgi:hypothetical protein
MLNKSDYLRDAITNLTLRGVSFTAPSDHYIALFTVTPTSAGGGTEVTGGSYTRLSVTFAAPGTPGATSNNAPLNFPTPTADWGNVVGAAVFDAATAGNMLYFGDLGTPRTIYAGDTGINFPAGYFAISEK